MDSKRIPDEKGLFVLKKFSRGEILAFYLGKTILDKKEQHSTVKKLLKLPESDPRRNYLMKVEGGGYLIDGMVPDPVYGNHEQCQSAFINHSKKSPNVVFVDLEMKGLHRYKERPMAVVALRDIDLLEELFAFYSDSYHSRLYRLPGFRDQYRCNDCKIEMTAIAAFRKHLKSCKAKSAGDQP